MVGENWRFNLLNPSREVNNELNFVDKIVSDPDRYLIVKCRGFIGNLLNLGGTANVEAISSHKQGDEMAFFVQFNRNNHKKGRMRC